MNVQQAKKALYSKCSEHKFMQAALIVRQELDWSNEDIAQHMVNHGIKIPGFTKSEKKNG